MLPMRWVCEQSCMALDALARCMPEASKNTLRSVLGDGRFFVNDQVVKKNLSLLPGAICELKQKKKFLDDIEILYEDKDIVVVDKPEGLLSVATDRETEFTLHAKLKQRYGQVSTVQRLDRETSGVLVFALNGKAREGLIGQFANHSIIREYRAIVIGNIPQKGTWRHHLVEDGNLKMHVTSHGGVLAETHFERLEERDNLSLVRFQLTTGKKNQIRVQSSYMGFPILGDKKYGKNDEFQSDRMYLHAHHLGFFHPLTKKKLSFFSPIPFCIR